MVHLQLNQTTSVPSRLLTEVADEPNITAVGGFVLS